MADSRIDTGQISPTGVLLISRKRCREDVLYPMACKYSMMKRSVERHAGDYCCDDCAHFGEPRFDTTMKVTKLVLCDGLVLLMNHFEDRRLDTLEDLGLGEEDNV